MVLDQMRRSQTASSSLAVGLRAGWLMGLLFALTGCPSSPDTPDGCLSPQAPRPGPRAGAAAVYVQSRGQIVIFGGEAALRTRTA